MINEKEVELNMSFDALSILHVKYFRKNDLIDMGRLAFKNGVYFFEYNTNFLDLKLELSPFKLPLKPGVIRSEDTLFDGLFGVFNDCLPDGWGKLLLDRKLKKLGINPFQISALDRLHFVGIHGMGALRFVPSFEERKKQINPLIDLDLVEIESKKILADEESSFVDELLVLNGSSAGARPKILVTLIKKRLETTAEHTFSTNNDWLIKFKSSSDPIDVGPIEYAYHLMAKEAGLLVPEAKLFKSDFTHGYFGVKRFDHAENAFFHMHTASGLLHADHRLPSLDYKTLLRATLRLTKDRRQVEEQFRYACFNVYAHNRDDHAKNFSYLMSPEGVWSVSPAYDLIFSMGPGGEHCTSIMGEGKNPGREHLLKLAKDSQIEETVAKSIIKEVQEAISKWSTFAKKAGVSVKSRQMIQKVLSAE